MRKVEAKWILLALIPLATVSPVAAQVKNPEAFVYAVAGDFDSLDPHWEYDTLSAEAQYQLYEGLVGYKGGSTTELEPLLASVVPTRATGLVSADGLTYRFPLRKGVVFHDKTALAPEDARYSLLRFLLTDREGGPSAVLLEPLLGVTSTRGPDGKVLPGLYEEAAAAVRIEGGALVLKLKKPFAPLLQVLAAFAPVVSKAWTVAHGGWDGEAASWARFHDPPKESATYYERANGTGPFRLDRWDRQNKRLVLVRHDGYWRKPAALRALVFQTVDEPSARRLALAAGDADLAVVERQFLPQVEGTEGVVVEDELPMLEVHNSFVFNFKINTVGNGYVGSGQLDGKGIPSEFFADEHVRKGLAHSFNYDAYIREGYRGKGTRARGPIPAGVFGHDPSQRVPGYDPAKALAEFKQAFGGKLFEKGFLFTVVYQQGRADRQLACDILKRGVEALDPRFKVEVRGVQWSTYLSHFAARKLPMINARWTLDYPDAHNAVFPFLHPDGHYARSMGYASPRAQRLIEAALREPEPDKRRALYGELQALAALDLPALFTVDTYHVRARRLWVRGLEYNPILPYGYFYPVVKGE